MEVFGEKKSEPIRTPTENFSVEVLFWGYVGPMLRNVWGSMEISRGKKSNWKLLSWGFCWAILSLAEISVTLYLANRNFWLKATKKHGGPAELALSCLINWRFDEPWNLIYLRARRMSWSLAWCPFTLGFTRWIMEMSCSLKIKTTISKFSKHGKHLEKRWIEVIGSWIAQISVIVQIWFHYWWNSSGVKRIKLNWLGPQAYLHWL